MFINGDVLYDVKDDVCKCLSKHRINMIYILNIYFQVTLGRESHPYSDCIDPNIDRPDINVYEQLYPKTRYSPNVSIDLLDRYEYVNY